MAEYVARKPATVAGRSYRPGEVVPVEDLDSRLTKRLLEQNRIAPAGSRFAPPSRQRRGRSTKKEG